MESGTKKLLKSLNEVIQKWGEFVMEGTNESFVNGEMPIPADNLSDEEYAALASHIFTARILMASSMSHVESYNRTVANNRSPIITSPEHPIIGADGNPIDSTKIEYGQEDDGEID